MRVQVRSEVIMQFIDLRDAKQPLEVESWDSHVFTRQALGRQPKHMQKLNLCLARSKRRCRIRNHQGSKDTSEAALE